MQLNLVIIIEDLNKNKNARRSVTLSFKNSKQRIFALVGNAAASHTSTNQNEPFTQVMTSRQFFTFAIKTQKHI